MGWVKLKELQKVDSKAHGFNYWKIEDACVWHQGRKLRKADVDSFEIREDDAQVFIARDKDNIFHAWSLQKTIDRDTFKDAGNGYWLDCHFAYYEHETSIKPLKGEDAKHFKFIGGPYARDSKFAYYAGRVLKTCEAPLNLQLMLDDNCWYAGDGSQVYFDGAVIKGADFQTWKKLDGGFSCDSKNVYFASKKLPSVKLDSWKIIRGVYSADSTHVYYMNFKLKGADPKTWQLVEHNYSKDSNCVYYGNKIVEGADSKTFAVLGLRSAKDKNNEYVCSNIKTPSVK